MTKKIEVFNYTDDGSFITLIAECNLYDDQENLIKQFSRSPFSYASGTLLEEIQNNLTEVYSIYTIPVEEENIKNFEF